MILIEKGKESSGSTVEIGGVIHSGARFAAINQELTKPKARFGIKSRAVLCSRASGRAKAIKIQSQSYWATHEIN